MLAQGCVVLVDDTHRAADRSAVERWREELGARVLDELGTHCVIQVGSGQKAASAFRVAA
jgi:hypothetical protein